MVADNNKDKLTKRLFIAINIPEDIKHNIFSFANDLLGKNKYMRIVPASNIHVTLKFLGNIGIERIEKIDRVLRETAGGFVEFRYKISEKINAFPGPKNARVIFMGIDTGGDKISRIYNKLEDNLNRIKIDREKRKFFPHVTIARVKSNKDIRQLIETDKVFLDGVLDCPELTLFESKLRPSGAEYIVLNNYSLK
jgi:RNA 2',3'-cyclic 3'-phosphodiesterase